MTAPAFVALFEQVQALHAATPVLHGFADLPDGLEQVVTEPFRVPAADRFAAETALYSPDHAALRDAAQAVTPVAHWRRTYRGAAVDPSFYDGFGCFGVVGAGGPYVSPDLRAFMIYLPAGFHYPPHHHPAEELYFIVAGEAEFEMTGHAPRILRPGDHMLHPSGVAHATRTHDHPVLALVYWRGDITTLPTMVLPEDP
jgi:mannose-6-phosphate isomerase-like protein (cupin superfamily)